MGWIPKKCVVVPVDFSDESFAAIDVARGLVEEPGQLHLIHVLPVLAANEPGVVWGAVTDEIRSEHAEEALGQRLAKSGHPGCSITIGYGDPGSEIASFAEAKGADLVVLPSHGRTGLKRLLIGSVAERVVRLAHCPVLVLRD